MHEMQTIVTDDRGVCLSACHAAQLVNTVQKTAKRIMTLFGLKKFRGPRNIVDGGPDLHTEGKGIRCSLRQITLASCCY